MAQLMVDPPPIFVPFAMVLSEIFIASKVKYVQPLPVLPLFLHAQSPAVLQPLGVILEVTIQPLLPDNLNSLKEEKAAALNDWRLSKMAKALIGQQSERRSTSRITGD